MKNMVFAAFALATSTLGVSAPAHAQDANYYRAAERANDPAYQAARRSAYYGGGYGYNNYASPLYAAQSNMNCVQVLFFSKCSVKQPVKICYTPAGDPIEVSEKGARYQNTGRPLPREVDLTCGDSSYHASN